MKLTVSDALKERGSRYTPPLPLGVGCNAMSGSLASVNRKQRAIVGASGQVVASTAHRYSRRLDSDPPLRSNRDAE